MSLNDRMMRLNPKPWMLNRCLHCVVLIWPCSLGLYCIIIGGHFVCGGPQSHFTRWWKAHIEDDMNVLGSQREVIGGKEWASMQHL